MFGINFKKFLIETAVSRVITALFKRKEPSDYERGKAFSEEALRTREATVDKLRDMAEGAHDFNDFDRGVLDVCRLYEERVETRLRIVGGAK